MKKRYIGLERIKAAEREHAVALIAVGLLDASLRSNPSLLTKVDLEFDDYRALGDNLEATYVVRMFAEFEAGLRAVWAKARRKTTLPGMEQLLDALASWRKVNDADRLHAHEVREYRNSLVHDGQESISPIALKDASKYLCKFFRYMPPDW